MREALAAPASRLGTGIVALALVLATLPLAAPAAVDMAIVSIDVEGGTYQARDSLAVALTVRNAGDVATAFSVDLRASVNTLITASDPPLGVFPRGPLLPGELAEIRLDVPLPLNLLGSRYVGAMVVAVGDELADNDTAHDPVPVTFEDNIPGSPGTAPAGSQRRYFDIAEDRLAVAPLASGGVHTASCQGPSATMNQVFDVEPLTWDVALGARVRGRLWILAFDTPAQSVTYRAELLENDVPVGSDTVVLLETPGTQGTFRFWDFTISPDQWIERSSALRLRVTIIGGCPSTQASVRAVEDATVVDFEVTEGPPHTVAIVAGPSGTLDPVDSGGNVALTASASDSLAHPLGYRWTASCPGLRGNGTFRPAASVQSPSWTAPINATGDPGLCTITVRVDDGAFGLARTGSFIQTVLSSDTAVPPVDVLLIIFQILLDE